MLHHKVTEPTQPPEQQDEREFLSGPRAHAALNRLFIAFGEDWFTDDIGYRIDARRIAFCIEFAQPGTAPARELYIVSLTTSQTIQILSAAEADLKYWEKQPEPDEPE